MTNWGRVQRCKVEGLGLSGMENGVLTRWLLAEGWRKRICDSLYMSRTNKEKSML